MREDRTAPKLTLIILRETLAICRMDKEAPVPNWAFQGGLSSVTRTKEELSIVCPQINIPKGIICNQGWSCLKVKGPLDLSSKGISLFSISTYDPDYVMVKEKDLEKAILALTEAGQQIQ